MKPPPLVFTLLKSARVPATVYSARDLQRLAVFVLAAEKVKGPAELSLDLTSPPRIQSLNRRFRGVDRTTDVISFRNDVTPHPPLSLRERVPVGRVRGLQGDIAINVHQAALQAKRVGHSLRRELRLLWIHGLLHLLGYTDYQPRPRRRMFKRQNELLRRWEKRR